MLYSNAILSLFFFLFVLHNEKYARRTCYNVDWGSTSLLLHVSTGLLFSLFSSCWTCLNCLTSICCCHCEKGILQLRFRMSCFCLAAHPKSSQEDASHPGHHHSSWGQQLGERADFLWVILVQQSKGPATTQKRNQLLHSPWIVAEEGDPKDSPLPVDPPSPHLP